MSSRHWIIEANTVHQRGSLRQWILQDADASLLQFFKLAMLPNGSLWALVSSDGSRCVEDLRHDFGYQGITEGTDDEWLDWCFEHQARCSEFLDAATDECFPVDSNDLLRQKGVDVFVDGAPDNDEFSAAVRHAVNDFRRIPRVSLGYWQLSGDLAHYRGRVVRNVSHDSVESIKRLGYSVSPFDQDVTSDLKEGFTGITPGYVTLFVGQDVQGLKTQDYPIQNAVPEY